MFRSITDAIDRDKDYPERQFKIEILSRVLNGEIYDHLQYGFHQEKNGADEYIPLRQRRPCVKYALCRSVVDDSVSLLFSEGHFPTVQCEDEVTRGTLAAIIKESKLNEVMIDAATRGSVGSVAVFLRILANRVFFSTSPTTYLTPIWQADAPDTLQKVIYKQKFKGQSLINSGWSVDDKDETYWLQREWDDSTDTYMVPYKVSDESPTVTPDTNRVITHNLGFVPIAWIKNLPGGDDIDGGCTFKDAIDTNIEIDYQLSQCGRGLKYSADPTLLIKEPASSDGAMVKGAGNAIVVDKDGDAKLLEINGSAASAVIEYVQELRKIAIESIHGNKADSDKLSAAQSGRAMEMLNQALVWLADRLRISYGEGALLSLLKMVIKASSSFSLVVDGEKVAPMDPGKKISLKWPAWFAPTYTDAQYKAGTLTNLRDSHLMSTETAVGALAEDYDIEDVPAELARIKADKAEDPPPTKTNLNIVEKA